MQGRVLIDGDGVRVAGEPRLEEVVDDGGVAGLKIPTRNVRLGPPSLGSSLQCWRAA